MPDAGLRRVDERFYAAFAQQPVARGSALLSGAAVQRELERTLNAATALASYRDFLAAARVHKARRQGASLEFERELGVQAATALRAGRQLGAATLRTAGHARNAGWIDRALDAWHDALAATPTVGLRDVLADVFEDPANRDVLQEAGLTQSLRDEISRTLEPLESTVSVQAGELRVEIPTGEGNDTHVVTLARDPRPGRPRNVTDLLAQGRLDVIADALDGSGLALADVAPTVGGTADREPSEVLLTGVLLMAQDLARHQRTLQDAGLALHEGRDAVIVGILIATAVLLVGGVVLAQLCENGNDAACKASPILFGLALLLLAAVVCVAETPVSGGAPGFLCAAAVGTALSFASAIVE